MQIYLVEDFILLFSEHFHENILEIKHDCCYSATVDSPSQLKNEFSNETEKLLKIGTRAF